MAAKSRSYGKNFATVGLMYSAVECFIEKVSPKFCCNITLIFSSNVLNMICTMSLQLAI